jgi:hypothetical protein
MADSGSELEPTEVAAILRRRLEKKSVRTVAQERRLSKTTVQKYSYQVLLDAIRILLESRNPPTAT